MKVIPRSHPPSRFLPYAVCARKQYAQRKDLPKDKKEAADTIKITREEPSAAIEPTTETTTVETSVTEVATTEIITEKQTEIVDLG